MQKFSLQFRDRAVQSILQRGQSKFVQLSFEPGEGLTKHRAPLALHVIVLTGKVRFTVGEEEEILNASELLALDPAIEHAVEAIDKSTVLLVLVPDAEPVEPARPASQTLEHENAFQHPELIEQIAPELRTLVEDHIEVCQVLQTTVNGVPTPREIEVALKTIGQELNSHFTAEENVLFPRMAGHVGGLDVGPVARLLEEHQAIRRLYAEAGELQVACQNQRDEHTKSLLINKMTELSWVLLNHLGKEDSHLFPMASRLLTDEEKAAVVSELAYYESILADGGLHRDHE